MSTSLALLAATRLETFSMSVNPWMAFLPELVLLAGILTLFAVSLQKGQQRVSLYVSLGTALLGLVACFATYGLETTLFDGAYRVDAFARLMQMAITLGYALVAGVSSKLPDIREDARPEYFLFLGIHVLGLTLLVACVDVIAAVIALECSSFPLFLMVALRREREGQRSQMESAIKYMMFGIAANGVMLFGLSYLYGLTGTTSLTKMATVLPALGQSPLLVVGLGMTLCGMFYKMAVFPFHFWTPDVYEGSSNETATLVSSLPKIGAVVLLVRFVSLANPAEPALGLLLAVVAAASMFYGNLSALFQNDFKRLMGFSGIAHAGFVIIGFAAQTTAGYTAALFTIIAYVLMILACFVVICRVSKDGVNVPLSELAGLHRRSPLLAATLAVGIFGLAGIPPMAGFIGKFALLTAAYEKGYLALVIMGVINSAIAIYYYLRVIKETYFQDPQVSNDPVVLDTMTRVVCVVLILLIVGMGIFPGVVLNAIAAGL
ncbi:MAG: NADH-quinone oxidoreductase subunit N [Verrucomicrobiota bacterium]|nr:NADH-quinone oxidoreductase subunit N [Verrucomicrobiota bacterium]